MMDDVVDLIIVVVFIGFWVAYCILIAQYYRRKKVRAERK
jgi:hypothetical protein